MDNKKILMSLGTAIAASKIAKTVTGIELDDVLGTVGLSRRRNHFLENLGLIAAGTSVGGAAALLLSPRTRPHTGLRLLADAGNLRIRTLEALREAHEQG